MEKPTIVILIIISCIKLSYSQHYFNKVISSSQQNVESSYPPAVEFDSTIKLHVDHLYRNMYSGEGYALILDKNGTVLKKEILDSVNNVESEDLLKINDSCYIICGSIFINADTVSKYWVSMINKNGIPKWTTIIDAKYRACRLKKINKLGNDKYVISGYTNRRIRGSAASDLTHPIHLILDTIGSLLHYVEMPNEELGKNLEDFYGATVDNDGNIFGGGTINYGTHINYDYLLAKTNSNGEILWKKVYKNSNFGEGFVDLKILQDGNLLAIGFSTRPNFSVDFFEYILLVNFSSDGNINWEKRLFLRYYIETPRCLQDSKGNFVCGGFIQKTQIDKANGLILKFTPAGDSLWLREINYTDRLGEQFFNISQASDGGYYLTGFSWVEGDNSSKPWIVKVDSFGCLVPGCEKPVAIEDIKSGKEKAFVFFPNPASHVFYFLSRVQDQQEYHMEIYNLLGQKMQDYPFKPYNGTQYQVDLKDDLTSGHYIIQVTDDKGKVMQREKMEVVR